MSFDAWICLGCVVACWTAAITFWAAVLRFENANDYGVRERRKWLDEYRDLCEEQDKLLMFDKRRNLP